MNGTSPIKRSAELQPLSREHHDGLLFVWKIRQGLTIHTDAERLKAYTNWYWRHHIKPHFYQEEKILMPFLPLSHPLRTRLKKEHDYIRELILTIDREPDKHDFIRLANLLETHIRFEERELFQHLEEQLSQEERSEIFRQLGEHPVSEEQNWKDEFWIKDKAG